MKAPVLFPIASINGLISVAPSAQFKPILQRGSGLKMVTITKRVGGKGTQHTNNAEETTMFRHWFRAVQFNVSELWFWLWCNVCTLKPVVGFTSSSSSSLPFSSSRLFHYLSNKIAPWGLSNMPGDDIVALRQLTRGNKSQMLQVSTLARCNC